MKKRLISNLLAIFMVLGMCFGLIACSSGNDEEDTQVIIKSEKEERKVDSYNSVSFGNLEFQIPNYYGENKSEKDTSMDYYAETGEGVVYLGFVLNNGEDFEKHYSSDYKKYINEFFKGLFKSSDIKDGRKLKSQTFETDEGLEAVETPFELLYDLGDDKLHVEGIMTIINNSEYDKLVICSVMQSERSEYEYREEYRKMIKSVKVIASSSTENSTTQTTDNTTQAPEATPPAADSSAIRPEFKQTMDNYEAWFDHYCEVMKAYKENPSDMNLMIEMTNLLSEEAAMLEEMDKMDQSQMNAAELAYYIEVTARIEKKLLEVAY